MKKELPIWAVSIVGLGFGFALLTLGILTDDPKVRRSFLALGGLLLLLEACAIAKWAWDIYKGRVSFDDLKKSSEQMRREADATLRDAQELLRRSERDDT